MASIKVWKDANKEHVETYNTSWRERNREWTRVYARQYWAENAENQRSVRAAWKTAHPDQCRLHDASRRARKKDCGGRLSRDIQPRLLRIQRGKCAYCRSRLGGLFHLDHIVPLARGGPNVDANVQLLCRPCNLSKKDRDPLVFMRSRGFLL